MSILQPLGGADETATTRSDGSDIAKLRIEATASKEAHSIEINNLDAVGIAKYFTHDDPNRMMDRKRVKEVKRHIKRTGNARLKQQFNIAMSVLRERNDFDDSTDYHRTNIIDGMAM